MNWLKWVTNNELHPRHEIEFDIIFFVINTVALVVGSYLFYINNEARWIAVLAIEYNWALDNMRHNR